MIHYDTCVQHKCCIISAQVISAQSPSIRSDIHLEPTVSRTLQAEPALPYLPANVALRVIKTTVGIVELSQTGRMERPVVTGRGGRMVQRWTLLCLSKLS